MKKLFLRCAILLFVAAGSCLAQETTHELRTWIDKSGNAVAAQFVKVERGILYLNDAAGKKITVNCRELSDADAEYVKTLQAVAVAATPKTQALSAGMKELLGPQLINVKGTRISTDTLGGKFIGLYFSNQYQSSRMTHFRLLDFYNGLLQRKEPFEIVFVSSDRTEEAMRGYMNSVQMPWLAVPLNSEICTKLNTRFAGTEGRSSGYSSSYGGYYSSGPTMFVVVAPDGQIVTHNGLNDLMNDPIGAFSNWNARYNNQKSLTDNRSGVPPVQPTRTSPSGMPSAFPSRTPPSPMASGFGRQTSLSSVVTAPSTQEYEIRVWTDRRGRTMQARFVKLDQGTLYLVDAAGAETAIVLNELSPVDLDYVIKAQAAAAAKTPPLAPVTPALKALLGEEFINAKGVKVPTDSLGGKIIGLYFSAYWYPSSQSFTPRLIEFYNALAAQKTPFEIVFVSADQTAEAMLGHMKEVGMPWIAVPWRGEISNRLSSQFSTGNFPALIIVGMDGQIISRAGRRDVMMGDPVGAFDRWRFSGSFN